ncbi:DUF1254 domain-containing protein [Cupriavidus sp. 30B13]|uniref:DUF1254 domain-containing protein n=1 Tax=Cupriavidus sp. 30B13 TaxID=3384241 RepID=UPI003B9068C7
MVNAAKGRKQGFTSFLSDAKMMLDPLPARLTLCASVLAAVFAAPSLAEPPGRADPAQAVVQRRAVESAIWGIPWVNFDMMFQAMKRAGGDYGQLAYWSRPSDWKNQTLTPNTDALYILPFWNTRDTGPMVLDLPPADDGAIVGSVMDSWQVALDDVGPAGADKGQGGKYLILPPGYKDDVPQGYIALRSQTYQGYALLRSIPRSGDEAGIARAVTYLKRIRFYPLSAAANPPEGRFVDVTDVVFDATIPYDMRFFASLDRMVQAEPGLERDRVMINMLKSIGIEKGKPFAPDARRAAAMKSGLAQARAEMTRAYESFPAYFPGKRWVLPAAPDLVKSVESGYTDPSVYPIDSRAAIFSAAFSTVKHLGTGQFYQFGMRDSKGRPLDGGRTYRLRVPPKVPVHQYWSATAYDFSTHGLIRNVPWGSRSSLTPGLQTNSDGSTDLFFGPRAPAGKQSNWVPTRAGERFETVFRFYGPDRPIFEKTWVLPDLERIQ